MSSFVANHVKRIFDRAGYGVLSLSGDRHGIVQGDGMRIVVAPYFEAAAKRFTARESQVRALVTAGIEGAPLKFDVFGGSVSANLEGIYLPDYFIDAMKEECATVYYRAQREVDAIFAAEDCRNAEWDEERQAYVGVVDQFTAQAGDGVEMTVRVSRIADQSFDAYESGEEEYDAAEARDIVEGRKSHGSIMVEMIIGHVEAGDRDAWDRPDERHVERGLVWDRDETGATTLETAAEVMEDNSVLAAAIKARAVEIASGAELTAQAGPRR